MKITYEFDPYEDSELLALHQNVNQMNSALIDIYEIARREIKYGLDEPTEDIIEIIKEILTEIQQKAAIIYDDID